MTILDGRKVSNDINNLIRNQYQKDDSISFNTLFPDLSDELSNILFELKPELKVEQPKQRFIISSEDKGFRRFAKRVKILIFKLHQFILNPTRAFLPKEKKQNLKIKYWKHKIPLRNLSYYSLRDNLLEELSYIYDETLRTVSKKSVAYWKYDESFDKAYITNFLRKNDIDLVKASFEKPETIINELIKIKEHLNKKILASYNRCEEKFNYNYERVGTIELSRSNFNSRNPKFTRAP